MIKNYLDQTVIGLTTAPKIFLGGPIPVYDAKLSWRKEALEILEELSFNGVAYIPEYRQPQSDELQAKNWEEKALELSTVIICWAPFETQLESPKISRLPSKEVLAKYKDKIIYARPNHKFVEGIDTFFEGCPKFTSLEELLQEAVARAQI